MPAVSSGNALSVLPEGERAVRHDVGTIGKFIICVVMLLTGHPKGGHEEDQDINLSTWGSRTNLPPQRSHFFFSSLYSD